MWRSSMIMALLLTAFVIVSGIGGMYMYAKDGKGLVFLPFERHDEKSLDEGDRSDEKPLFMTRYGETQKAHNHSVFRWTRTDGAVMYDVKVLTSPERQTGQDRCYLKLMPTQRTYTNGIELVIPQDFTGPVFYLRVQGLDMEGNPVGKPSPIEKVFYDSDAPFVEKPEPLSAYNEGNGTVLLYPVYDWIPIPGAFQYEVEILDDTPENPNGTAPSKHRIDSYLTLYGQQYDHKPRYGHNTFYWRVRALKEDGSALGVYSDAQPFRTDPDDGYVVAIYGDSISHGGGSISYSPTDWEFSYAYYLDFPTINLSQSGDTSTMTVERFERDVLPFHPQYLLIMMGSNSLRNGEGADRVISDMETLRNKCLAYGIQPIFLTIPPFNPDNVYRAFQAETVDDWQDEVYRVNEYIKEHEHIDITTGMYDERGYLRNDLALDGLHLDPKGKKMIGIIVNEAFKIENF